MNCKQGHPMAKAANGTFVKRCGECGSAALDAAMVKCSSGTCAAVFAKSAAPKHCTDCGEKVTEVNPEAEFEQSLTVLDVYAKSRAKLLDDLKELPKIGEDAVDIGAIQLLVKSAVYKDEDGKDKTDATPLIAETMKAIEFLQVENRALHEHIAKSNALLATDNTQIFDGLRALGHMVKSVVASIETLRGQSRGRRSIESLTIMPTPQLGGGDPMAKSAIGLLDVPDIDPGTLMVKATAARQLKPELFAKGQLATLQTWTNEGAGLRAIAAEHPALARACIEAIRIADGGAH
jgi:hypothetical protein